jgi:tetratricopeptide (TPR) repeat protein
MLCLKEAKLTDAEEQFLHALSLQKDFVPARMGLAKTYRLMDRLPESLEQLSAVLKEEPEDPSALLERGTVENMLGKKADARADFEHFSQAAPDRAEGELFLGKLDSDAGQYNSAIPHLQKAIALDANQADAYFYLGQADYRLGKSEEAKEALQHCLSLDPVNKAASQLLEQALKASPQAR